MWFFIALGSYFFLGLANTIDKFLLSKYVPHPVVYAFYVGVLGLVGLILIPFGVFLPALADLAIGLMGGFLFIMSLIFLYQAMKSGEASVVAPLVGGSTPIFLLVLSFIFLQERLNSNQLLAFIFLVAGLILIAYKKEKGFFRTHFKFLFKNKGQASIVYALIAGLFFALTYLLSKIIYIKLEFVTGFFWMRIGAFLTVVIIFLIPSFRKMIMADLKKPKKERAKGNVILLINQLFGVIGFVGINYAISLISATLVTAMQGIQYVFVFLLVMIFGQRVPQIKEKLNRAIITQKILAIILISIGLYFLNY